MNKLWWYLSLCCSRGILRCSTLSCDSVRCLDHSSRSCTGLTKKRKKRRRSREVSVKVKLVYGLSCVSWQHRSNLCLLSQSAESTGYVI
ncbi:hypothetical protein EDB82DRAFT_218911 [Fusarium venenatum]|uniref:uncharacterized protein n=1 Tax=Fusarium venenatum TaxID=56646 RepID=UPI001D8AC832|nr:hypothetical protein EDB82DRAFT_218911 [Fusarium venenatum]